GRRPERDPQSPDRLRLPVLPPAAAPERGRERGDPARLLRRAARAVAGAGAPPAPARGGPRCGRAPSPRPPAGGARARRPTRAPVTGPRVLLADEPTGNLESATGEQIADLLEEVHRQGRTVVLVTHNEALARRAQRLVRLRDGRLEDRA